MKSAQFERKFILSLGLNILILGLAGVMIANRGGVSYLVRQFRPAKTEPGAQYWFNNYYQHRRSLFEILPQSERPIIFIGDSLTDSCEWQEILNKPEILNRGIIGDTTDGVLQRLNPIVESRPRQIFLMIGINDLNQGKNISDILVNYQQILSIIQEQSPQTQVYIKSVLPVNNQFFKNAPSNETIRIFNTQLQRLSEIFSYSYIDLHSQLVDENQNLDERYTVDGLHLNGMGYLVWKEAIENDVE